MPGRLIETGHGWWAREGGAREVLRVALPLVASSISWTILTFIDRIFLLWWSETSFAASFPAALYWWTLVSLPFGICMYVQTFVAQYTGAQQHHMVGRIVWQGVWLAVLATPLIVVGWLLAPSIFAWANHSADVVAEELVYFGYLSWSSPALLISCALSGFYAGRGRTRMVATIDAGAALLNIALDYWWIFGGLGLPAGGIAGAAIATTVVTWLKVVIYSALIFRAHHRQHFHTHHWRIDRQLFGKLMYFGGPGGLQICLEVGGFSVFILMIGSLGLVELAATNLAFNVSSLAFHPVMGLSMATSILVGQYLGANREALAVRITWTSMALACFYMTTISFIYVVFPDLVLFGFFQAEPTDNREEIRAMGIILLRFVAAYNLFDAMNLVFSFAIKGAGDTHFVMYVSFVMAVLLVASTWLLRNILNLGIYECWMLVTGWVCILGIVYWLRFRQGRWLSMRVVE
ncbi:MAG TPA: MATE family efflux transporter [Pirellulaceae bacterium]|nr:MATE family efflux transporter [Pirellulaceae bacterium]